MDLQAILDEITALRTLVEQQQARIATLELVTLTNTQERNKHMNTEKLQDTQKTSIREFVQRILSLIAEEETDQCVINPDGSATIAVHCIDTQYIYGEGDCSVKVTIQPYDEYLDGPQYDPEKLA